MKEHFLLDRIECTVIFHWIMSTFLTTILIVNHYNWCIQVLINVIELYYVNFICVQEFTDHGKKNTHCNVKFFAKLLIVRKLNKQ